MQDYKQIERIRRRHELLFYRELSKLFLDDLRALKTAIRQNPAEAGGLIDTLFNEYRILEIVRINYERIGSAEAVRVYEMILDKYEQKAAFPSVGFASEIIMAIIRRIAGRPEIASRIKNVSDNMKNTVRTTLQEAMKTTLSARSIASLFTADFGRQRALRIVRTETTIIFNEASMTGAKSTGVPLKKRWLAGSDARTRDSHLEMNNKPAIPLDSRFQVGQSEMMQPGDAAGGAKEVVNCRCTVTYELDRV